MIFIKHLFYKCNRITFVGVILKMEEIQKVIAEIEMKIVKMRTSLMDARTKNEALESELNTIKEKLGQREREALDFKQKYDELRHQKEQGDWGSDKNSDDENAQIDALVREIDDCIGRLKA